MTSLNAPGLLLKEHGISHASGVMQYSRSWWSTLTHYNQDRKLPKMAPWPPPLLGLVSRHTVGSPRSQRVNVIELMKFADKLNSSTKMWDQNLYIDGQLVSSISTSESLPFRKASSRRADIFSLPGKGQQGQIFYVSIECADGSCAAAPAHSKTPDLSLLITSTKTRYWQRLLIYAQAGRTSPSC